MARVAGGVAMTASPDRRPLLVCGCGYSGEAVARLWSGPVWGTTRNAERAEQLECAGVRAVLVDFTEPGPLPELPADLAEGAAVLTMGPDTSLDDPHAPLRRALSWVRTMGIRHIAYLSSTSVYGSSGGDVVRADSPVDPDSDMGRRRLEAEGIVRAESAHGATVRVIRLPGIYGPGRTIRGRLEAGSYRLVDGGRGWSNRIFVDDIATAVCRVLAPDVGEGVWLASDGNPFRVVDLVRFACERLGLPMPPTVPLSEVSPRVRPFWTGNRRCDPDALRALGWEPRWPSYREGLPEAWRREADGEH